MLFRSCAPLHVFPAVYDPAGFMVVRQSRRRSGVAATAVFSAGISAAFLARPEPDWVGAVANGGLSCLFSLFIGLWFWRVYDISAALASALDNERVAREGLAADRKSTRLNSSHSSISYAVFCLKKNSP